MPQMSYEQECSWCLLKPGQQQGSFTAQKSILSIRFPVQIFSLQVKATESRALSSTRSIPPENSLQIC